MNNSSENFKQLDELTPLKVKSADLLSAYVTLEESVTLDDVAQKSSIEIGPFFQKIKKQIENNICDLGTVVDNLNKLREEAAKLESDLTSLTDCSTWQNISEFIGMSSTNIIEECMKTFDEDNDSEWNSVM